MGNIFDLDELPNDYLDTSEPAKLDKIPDFDTDKPAKLTYDESGQEEDRKKICLKCGTAHRT